LIEIKNSIGSSPDVPGALSIVGFDQYQNSDRDLS
jgi:hypothetical protein